jgi:hypothetical protein
MIAGGHYPGQHDVIRIEKYLTETYQQMYHMLHYFDVFI